MNEIRFYKSLFGKRIGGRRWVGEVAVMGETWSADNNLMGESLRSLWLEVHEVDGRVRRRWMSVSWIVRFLRVSNRLRIVTKCVVWYQRY